MTSADGLEVTEPSLLFPLGRISKRIAEINVANLLNRFIEMLH